MKIGRREALKRLLILGGSLAFGGAIARVVAGSARGMTAPAGPAASTGGAGLASSTGGTLSGAVRLSSITVPRGRVLRFDPDRTTTVEVSSNVLVEGTLRMRPARRGVIHTLRFIDVDESAFQGGGHEVLESDVGLWVRGRGRLDLVGTRRAGWNRTGDHPTWTDSDEIMVTPTDPEDSTVRSFVRGSAVPRAREDLPPAEVFNLTRNVRIEGTPGGRSHVHIMTSVAQTIRYASFRHLGPTGVVGRYPLHLHMMGNASRGSVVKGCVVRDSGNNGFWTHLSNGITLRDCVAYKVVANSKEGAACYGWDTEHSSHAIRWERCLAVAQDSDLYRTGMFLLGQGDGNACVDCAGSVFTSKTGGSGGSAVFHWGKKGINQETGVWRFPLGNVAHNVAGNGLSTWQNDNQIHNVDGFVVYRCERAGIDHGAYQNAYRYRDGRIVECGHYGVFVHADSQESERGTLDCRFERLTIDSTPVGFNKVGNPNPGAPIVICGAVYREVETELVVESGAVEPRVRSGC